MAQLFYSEEEWRDAEDERLGLNEPAYFVHGVPCATYEEACLVAGCDTPDQTEAEERHYFEMDCIDDQDAMEARGGPAYGAWGSDLSDDDLPF